MALLCVANGVMENRQGENKAKSVVMKHPSEILYSYHRKSRMRIGKILYKVKFNRDVLQFRRIG